jgi:release factor glutamine methyltransferase
MADLKLVTWTRDVYEPSDDSFLLVDALQARLERSDEDGGDGGGSDGDGSGWPRVALEIGCGSGYVITSLALMLKKQRGRRREEQQQHQQRLLLATDVSAPALASTAATLEAHGLRAGADVELVRADLAEPLLRGLRGYVDLLVFNPPYVPTPDDEVVAPVLPPAEGNGDGGGGLGIVAAAWAGGDRGRRVVDRLLPRLDELLSEEGEAFVVAVQENDPAGMIRAVEEGRRAGEEREDEVAAGDPAASPPPCRRRPVPPPLKGEVVLRRAADEEALCILRFSRARAEEG